MDTALVAAASVFLGLISAVFVIATTLAIVDNDTKAMVVFGFTVALVSMVLAIALPWVL